MLDSELFAPDAQYCLATTPQSCIAKAALTIFGQPCRHPVPKGNQKWYDTKSKTAQAALRNTGEDGHEIAVKVRSYKQLLCQQHLAWEDKAHQFPCAMASRNSQSILHQYNDRQTSECNIPREQWQASVQVLCKASEKSAAATAVIQRNLSSHASPQYLPLPLCT